MLNLFLDSTKSFSYQRRTEKHALTFVFLSFAISVYVNLQAVYKCIPFMRTENLNHSSH